MVHLGHSDRRLPPRPAKLSATPIAHAPGLTVPAAVAVQEVAAVGVAVCSTAAAGVAQ